MALGRPGPAPGISFDSAVRIVSGGSVARLHVNGDAANICDADRQAAALNMRQSLIRQIYATQTARGIDYKPVPKNREPSSARRDRILGGPAVQAGKKNLGEPKSRSCPSATGQETHPHEAQEHHRPSGCLGDRSHAYVVQCGTVSSGYRALEGQCFC
jgi:hypothetical protein